MNTELFVKWLKIQYWNMLHEIRAHFGFYYYYYYYYHYYFLPYFLYRGSKIATW